MQLFHDLAFNILCFFVVYIFFAGIGLAYSIIRNIVRPKYYKRTFARLLIYPSYLIKKLNFNKVLVSVLLIFIMSLTLLEGFRYMYTSENSLEYLKSPYTKSQMYVYATSQYNKTYKLPADTSKNNDDEWDSEYLVYRVYFPNGGYLHFHNESVPADFGATYDAVDQDGNDWSIMLTRELIPNTTTYKSIPVFFIFSLIGCFILSMYWFKFDYPIYVYDDYGNERPPV